MPVTDPTTLAMIEAASRVYGVDPAQVANKDRSTGRTVMVTVRAAVALAYRSKGFALERIAERLDRDHSTIHHHIAKGTLLLDQEEDFKRAYHAALEVLAPEMAFSLETIKGFRNRLYAMQALAQSMIADARLSLELHKRALEKAEDLGEQVSVMLGEVTRMADNKVRADEQANVEPIPLRVHPRTPDLAIAGS